MCFQLWAIVLVGFSLISVKLDSGYAKLKTMQQQRGRSATPAYDEKRYFVSPGFQYELMEDT